jgi:hypothetical protein
MTREEEETINKKKKKRQQRNELVSSSSLWIHFLLGSLAAVFFGWLLWPLPYWIGAATLWLLQFIMGIISASFAFIELVLGVALVLLGIFLIFAPIPCSCLVGFICCLIGVLFLK